MAAGVVFALSSVAIAQDAVGVIEQRIESTFDLVIGNSLELAIPLTRRALARRSAEGDAVEPLAYHEETPDGSNLDARQVAPAPSAFAVQEGVAEGDADDDLEIARLPRPRPDPDRADEALADEPQADELQADEAPLDLVAGAPAAPLATTLVADAAPLPEPAAAAAALEQPILPPSTGQPAPELVATSACLSPSDVTDKDGDFERNADALSGNAFCIAQETFKERKRTWTLQSIKTNRPGPLWAVMHDDEDMSFDNAVQALKSYGGTLVTVDTGGRRNMDGIDPNRNFSADGIGCSKLGTDAAPRYTEFFRDLITDEPIIALHNNVDGPVSTGGLGHASMESVAKDMQVAAASDKDGPLAGERSLILLVSPVPVTATSEKRAAALNARGINVMIEGVRDEKGDCSLSNYALLTDHPDYLNITVDNDERDKQRKIIDAIMDGRAATVATQ